MATALVLDGIDLPAALRGSETLSALTDFDLCELAARMTVVALADGDEVIRQGTTCEVLYLVLSGTVVVSARDERGLMHTVEEAGPGDLVGDMSMFLRAPELKKAA
jgi:CRP-like cAMP-binding protein